MSRVSVYRIRLFHYLSIQGHFGLQMSNYGWSWLLNLNLTRSYLASDQGDCNITWPLVIKVELFFPAARGKAMLPPKSLVIF